MFYYLLLESNTDVDEIYLKIIKSPQLVWVENCCIKKQPLMPRAIYFENIRYNDSICKKLIGIFLQNINYKGHFELYKPLIKNVVAL